MNATVSGLMAADDSTDREYLKIARAIGRLIEAGRIRVGDRLPSIRDMARETRCASGTVTAAYELLSERGMIVPQSTRGYIVRSRSSEVRPISVEVRAFREDMLRRGYSAHELRCALNAMLEEKWG